MPEPKLTKEDKRHLKGQKLSPNSLPEAPASATVRVWIDGYGAMITMRNEKVGTVMERLAWVVNYAKKKGWKPSWKEDGDKDPDWIKETDEKPKTKACPTCGADMKFKSGVSKKGNKYALWECKENDSHTEWVDSK